ncbi:hypothetical protein C7S14_8043 [Burkholderia cepacia]|nr:hypothetical protein C7S14_8043 [Burkholderia cepacia]
MGERLSFDHLLVAGPAASCHFIVSATGRPPLTHIKRPSLRHARAARGD